MLQETYRQALAALDTWVPNPNGGVPEEFFHFLSRFTPIVNVDLLIQDERRRTLLTWRDDDIYGAGWHIPGGIIRYRETTAEAIRATSLRELGTDAGFDTEPLAVLQSIEPVRRERGHFISLLYRCRLLGPPSPALAFSGGQPRRDQWAWHQGCPPDLIAVQADYRKFL